MTGKLHPDLLAKYIFPRIGLSDPDVIVGPSYGEDAAVIKLKDEILVIHANPITGAIKYLGWLAVNIACNDVAVRGAKPRWLLSIMLLPENYGEEQIDKITKQLDNAAKELGVMIVGGHSEYTPGIDRPLIAMTSIGVTSKGRFVTTSGARPGDVLLMTKTAGLEGTAILASDFREELLSRGVSEKTINQGEKFIHKISVVKEALALADVGVTSMHDPTEGGLLGGIAEIAYASNVKIEVWEEKIAIARETKELCRALHVDPLKLISSGVLLATISRNVISEALSKLQRLGIKASIIGEVHEGTGVTLYRTDGTSEHIGKYVKDELFRLWEELK